MLNRRVVLLALPIIGFLAMGAGAPSRQEISLGVYMEGYPQVILSELPTCDATSFGATVQVTDAVAFDSCAAGSGSNSVLCTCDGTNWQPNPPLADDTIDAGMIADDNCTSVVSFAINPDEAGTNIYVSPNSTTPNATEANVDTYMTPGQSLVVSDMRAVVDVAPSSGKSWTITLRDDGSNIDSTCQITNANTNCVYAAGSSVIAAGSKLTASVVGAGTPTTAAEMLIAFCLNGN